MKTNIICLTLLLFWQTMSYAQGLVSGITLTQEQVSSMDKNSSMKGVANENDIEEASAVGIDDDSVSWSADDPTNSSSSSYPYCQSTSLTLTSSVHPWNTKTYRASHLIQSTQSIHSNADVKYTAGQLIRLKPGFTAQAGSSFNASIADCYGYVTAAESDARTITQPIGQAAETIEEKIQVSCYPNPLSDRAVIEFELEEDADVSLELFDINGRKVQTILNSLQTKGSHKVDLLAAGLANGIYFAQLRTKHQFSSLKILVHK